MRAAIIALMLTIATQAGAECGYFCDLRWWQTTTKARVQVKLDTGADVMARDEGGWTPLHFAAASGNPATIQPLLAAGVNVMARDKGGRTPLHFAAVSGHPPAIIQALLYAGTDVMVRDGDGWTPLHAAASCTECADGVIEKLLSAGAKVKDKNKEGKTPWDLAQKNENLKGTKGYWALNDAQYN